MAKKVVFSKKAFIDLDRIIEFNNRRNKSNTHSKIFLIGLHKRLELLQNYPLNGIVTDEENVLLLIWDQYYVFYTYNDLIIEIKSLYHQKENVTR